MAFNCDYQLSVNVYGFLEDFYLLKRVLNIDMLMTLRLFFYNAIAMHIVWDLKWA